MSKPTTTLVPRDGAPPPAVTADQRDLILRTVAVGATPDELQLYFYDCARQGVHPLDKLIYFSKRGGKYTPMTSIDFLRIRAAETDEYAGNDDPRFVYSKSPDVPDEATVTVYRLVQGTRCSFTATVRWREYVPEAGPNGRGDVMWRKMPHGMLGKCAEAAALRKGFPRQLAGLYVSEELDQMGDAPPRLDPLSQAASPDPLSGAKGSPISEAQLKRLFALAKEQGGWAKDTLKAMLAAQGYDSSKDIPWTDYDRICALVQAGPTPATTGDDVPFSK